MNGSMDKTFVVKSEGILHGIPVLPESAKDLRAIVVGASGTSGQPLTEVLSSNPQRWQKVFALSRKAPQISGTSNIEHVPMDLLWDPEKISALLVKYHVQAEYIFYFGYAQVPQSQKDESAVFGDAEQLAELNRRLLENFLTALDQASISPKRIILQTGGKNYGVHQGHVNVPLTEGAPRVELEPNFYYAQEDSLAKYCRSHRGVGYNVTMPQWILSAVANTNMTIFYPLAVYASTQRKLNNPLRYPGDLTSWDNTHPISTGLLMGKFYEWLVLTPETSGESFNFTDGSEFTFGKLWPVLASWFGVQWLPPEEDSVYHEVRTPFSPRGYGPKGRLRSSFSFIEWAKEPATRRAWMDLTKEYGLITDPLSDAESTFAFLQFALELTWSWATSMDKARKYGWFGHCDSIESMRVVFERFEDMKMIPPLRK